MSVCKPLIPKALNCHNNSINNCIDWTNHPSNPKNNLLRKQKKSLIRLLPWSSLIWNYLVCACFYWLSSAVLTLEELTSLHDLCPLKYFSFIAFFVYLLPETAEHKFQFLSYAEYCFVLPGSAERDGVFGSKGFCSALPVSKFRDISLVNFGPEYHEKISHSKLTSN